MDPYFYGLTGQELWNSLTGVDTSQATALELDEISPRYGIALIKSLVKFIQDGIDVGSDVISENSVFELEKIVFTSRGQIGIWLPSNKVENLRILGAKIANHTKEGSEEEGGCLAGRRGAGSGAAAPRSGLRRPSTVLSVGGIRRRRI